jgi:hypothetical protein
MASRAGAGRRCALNRGCYYGTRMSSIDTCGHLRPGAFELFVCDFGIEGTKGVEDA